MRNSGVALVALLASGSLLACSGGSTAPSTAEQGATTNTSDGGTASGPKLRVFVDHGGGAQATSRIVYTEPFEVRIDGLAPGAEVELVSHAYAPDSTHDGYEAKVTFVADASGSVSTKTMAPARGSYEGTDPDGIVWSAERVPLPHGMGSNKTSLYLQAKVGQSVVTKLELQRPYTADGVTVKDATEDGLVAKYYEPQGTEGKIPIVAFGGSEGGIDLGEDFAALFASWGYPTLAVAYFGANGVPGDLKRIPLDYFEKAFAWLDAQPHLRHGKAIVVGTSRGGELALLLGATYPKVVAGVIAETPSLYRWGAASGEPVAAWTYQGHDLSFVPEADPNAQPSPVQMPGGGTAWTQRPLFENDLAKASAAALDGARIRVEDIEGPVLMVGGSADGVWPACDFVARATKVLEQAGHTATYADEGICSPDAGHMLGTTGVPTTGSMWLDNGSFVSALGGTAKGNATSGRLVYDKARAFLGKVEQ